MFQTGSGEDGKSIDNSAQTLAKDQTLEVCYNSFPLVVVRIRKPLERQFGWKKTIIW
jgi:hypothetical protein